MDNFKKFWKLGRPEFGTEYFAINKDNELIIREGNFQYNVFDIARKYGTSMEICLPFVIEERLSNLFKLARTNTKQLGYKGKFSYHFPMKVNQNREFVLPLLSEGANLEVASANDLWVVKKLWIGENFHSKISVMCNGPKTVEYIELIKLLRDHGLGIIPVIESVDELSLFKKFNGDIGVRINLKSRVDSHWDKDVDMFGLYLKDILSLGKIRNLKVLHYHIGSQISKGNDIIVALREAFEAYKKIRVKNPGLDTINIGGGFAVDYDKRKIYSVESVMKRIFKTLKTLSDKAGIPHPNIIVEWGRYIAAPAQMTVYKIIASKDIKKAPAKQWYVIDGSFMNDLLDTWSIEQQWHIVPVNNLDFQKKNKVWLAGLTCDSDDVYKTDDDYLWLPTIEDFEDNAQYIAVLDTGAYQNAFTSHHCMLSSPLRVMLQDGNVKVIRKRQSSEDVGKLFGW